MLYAIHLFKQKFRIITVNNNISFKDSNYKRSEHSSAEQHTTQINNSQEEQTATSVSSTNNMSYFLALTILKLTEELSQELAEEFADTFAEESAHILATELMNELTNIREERTTGPKIYIPQAKTDIAHMLNSAARELYIVNITF